jgi:hypothetical protein
MKNNHLALLLCFFCAALQAQITDLNKLSKGKFYSSDVIKDENNNIKGYFLLFESDKVAKETYELEYVVLDENLTKVTNGFITEMKYESWLVDAENIQVRTSVYKNKMLLQLADQANGMEFFKRYRMLNIADNEVSKPFIFVKDTLRKDPVMDRKNSNYSNNESEPMAFYQGVGLMVNSKTLNKKAKMTVKYLAHYDDSMNEVWKYTYDDIENKKQKGLSYLNSDADVIVMFNHFTKSNSAKTYLNDFSALFLDAKKGTLIKEFEFPQTDKFCYKVVDCKITADKIYLLGNYSVASEYGNTNDTKNTGLFNFVFDKQTGKQTGTDYLKWETLETALNINKSGYIKKEGYVFIHNMLLQDNGKIIVVAETFLQDPITTNNMYFLELSEKFTMNQVFEVAKFKNKFPNTSAHSNDIKKYGLFDFIDYQDLGDNEYLFFLNDNEKNSRNRKKSTLYGIVSYADGKFTRQTLDLKTETSSISAYNAKKGYLMVIENFDEKNKPTEFRLEKINY